MPVRPDYAALVRGQLALLGRIDAGDTGTALLTRVVRLALEVTGGVGAGFAEYAAGHGRIVAAAGACERTLGRRVSREDDGLLAGVRSRLVALDSVSDEVGARLVDAEAQLVLGARCEIDGFTVGALHIYYGRPDEEPGQEHHEVAELLAGLVAHLYADRTGLPVHTDAPLPATAAEVRAGDREGVIEHWKRRHEDRDLFVAVTSHELRTPVTVIKGYADTLTNHWESLGEPGRQEAARVIGARAGELARLVDRLLSATSEDRAAGDAPPGPFDLVEALRAAAGVLPEELARRVTLAELPAELPKAFGDRESLATILTELATNAGKYSPPATEVTVTATADESTVTFAVADRGIGVRPEHRELAFERYWQGEPQSSGHNPGAGLGLYLVRRIVERQHGWVSLHPREGGGTVAEVRFPRA